ncbi:MAG: lipid A deacylase LpxR family protein [Verrucomicrobiota bacterium]
MRLLFGAATLLLLMASASSAFAARGVNFLVIDNDAVVGTDSQYTAGIRFSQTRVAGARSLMPRPVERFASTLLPGEGTASQGLFLAQYIFTPQDKNKIDLGSEDRPYAGWLGGGIWLREATSAGSGALGLSLGLVGPSSLAEAAQDTVHELIGSDKYVWSEALKDEPTVNLHYRIRRGVAQPELPLGINADAHLEGGLDVGTVKTQALARVLLRIGSFSPVYHFPAERFGPGPEMLNGPDPSGPQIAFQVGVEGRAVAHDIFLDGNVFHDSHSVDRKPWVGSLVAGIDLRWDSLEIRYNMVFNTRQYEGQEGGHDFGSLVAAWWF